MSAAIPVGPDALDGHPPLQALVPGEEHLSHAAPAEELQDLVVADEVGSL